MIKYNKQRELEENWTNDWDADPDQHIQKLKAKIMFKVEKKYLEDKKNEQAEKNKTKEENEFNVKRDLYGRIIEKKFKKSKMMSRKPTQLNRIPRQVPQLKRRVSFTEDKLLINVDLLTKSKRDFNKITPVEQQTIDRMKEFDRYPIPESLLGRQKVSKFSLFLDSLIRNAYNLQEIEKFG